MKFIWCENCYMLINLRAKKQGSVMAFLLSISVENYWDTFYLYKLDYIGMMSWGRRYIASIIIMNGPKKKKITVKY